MDTQTQTMIAAIVVVGIVAAVLAWWYVRRRQHERLRERFGPEYDRTVREKKSVSKAEAELAARAERVKKFDIRPLTPDELRRFTESWRDVQTRFVDDPAWSVVEADRLVGDVMHARGYPVATFEQRAADISVDHPVVCERYRAAHDIANRHRHGQASTEDLRQALVHYRALLEDLLEVREPEVAERPDRPVDRFPNRRAS